MTEDASQPLLDARDLHKSYLLEGTVINVLKGAALSVAAGETVAVVGLSGAGKSTLLHVLGGLDEPDSGRVIFDGSDMYAVSGSRLARFQSSLARTWTRARSIGFVFQAYHLFPELNVLENVLLPTMIGIAPADATAPATDRALELLTTVGLADRAGHRPMELSGGEQQRLALVRALMNDPRLVLADEPTGNLDSETGRTILDHLFKLTRERGRTLVIVTHNDELASRCDRKLRLTGGLLLRD